MPRPLSMLGFFLDLAPPAAKHDAASACLPACLPRCRMGIPEDPVTGSAHAVLAPFWAQRLGGKGRAPGGDALCARQCSARGGEISVRCIGDTVQVEGCAVVVLSGTLCH